MNGLFGPFEKIIVALLVILFGIYFSLEAYFPSVVYPELRKVHSHPAVSMNPCPRQGKIVPTSGYGKYLSNPLAFQSQAESEKKSDSSAYDPTKINWFVKGTDGVKHPTNAYLQNFRPFHTNKYWLPLLAVSLRVRYLRDDAIQPDDDTWQTSYETYARRLGDCEDHAILLADWMTTLGYDARVVVGELHGQGHAWVVLLKDGKEYLLESTDKASRRRFPLVKYNPEYDPQYMFNRDHFWAAIKEYRGWRNRQATKRWINLSDFVEGPA